jgi:hypothetical protein
LTCRAAVRHLKKRPAVGRAFDLDSGALARRYVIATP